MALNWLVRAGTAVAIWCEDNLVIPPQVTLKAKRTYKYENAEIRKGGQLEYDARSRCTERAMRRYKDEPTRGEVITERDIQIWLNSVRKLLAAIVLKKQPKKMKKAAKKGHVFVALVDLGFVDIESVFPKKGVKGTRGKVNRDGNFILDSDVSRYGRVRPDGKIHARKDNVPYAESIIPENPGWRAKLKAFYHGFSVDDDGGEYTTREIKDDESLGEDNFEDAKAFQDTKTIEFPAVPEAEPMSSEELVQDAEAMNGDKITFINEIVSREPVLA